MCKKVSAVLIAFFYSLAYTIVGPMTKEQDFSINKGNLWSILLCFVICSAVNIFIICIFPKLKHFGFYRLNDKIEAKIARIDDGILFLFIWAFIFVMWLPAFLVLFPGVLSYDMISQTGSALGQITNNHHPVLHTWLLRVFMNLGFNLFSSYEIGLGILSFLQMVVLSYALSRMIMLLKKKNVPILIVILTTLFMAFWFMNAVLSVTMIKDTLHAAFLILFCCHFTEMVTSPSDYAKQKRNFVFFPIVSFLMFATRNNGIYIYIFCFLALFVLKISRIKRIKKYVALIGIIVLPVILFKIYTGPIFNILGIEPGQIREALSVPIQQIQRVSVMRSGELTDEQVERIGYYIDSLEWMGGSASQSYDPFNADFAKSCFYSSSYESNPIAFWKFYVKLGLQFPKEYIVAFLSNTLGFWYPGYYEFSYVASSSYSPEMFPVPLQQKSILNSGFFEKYYESLCNADFWRSTWGLRVFFVSGFAPWILLLMLVYTWHGKGFVSGKLPLFAPMVAQYGIMLLSPIASFRYSWPYILMLPILFIAIFDKIKILERGDDENQRN